MIKEEYTFLRSINKWINSYSGDILNATPNGNIDDEGETLRLIEMKQAWWDSLSTYDLRLCDIIFGGILDGES